MYPTTTAYDLSLLIPRGSDGRPATKRLRELHSMLIRHFYNPQEYALIGTEIHQAVEKFKKAQIIAKARAREVYYENPSGH